MLLTIGKQKNYITEMTIAVSLNFFASLNDAVFHMSARKSAGFGQLTNFVLKKETL